MHDVSTTNSIRERTVCGGLLRLYFGTMQTAVELMYLKLWHLIINHLILAFPKQLQIISLFQTNFQSLYEIHCTEQYVNGLSFSSGPLIKPYISMTDTEWYLHMKRMVWKPWKIAEDIWRKKIHSCYHHSKLIMGMFCKLSFWKESRGNYHSASGAEKELILAVLHLSWHAESN